MSVVITIEDQIEDGLTREVSNRKLNGNAIIHFSNSDEDIRIPMNSIISKYRDYFEKYVLEVPLTEEEEREYAYSPKKFSQFMYKTTEYWGILLHINDCHSILDFKPTGTIKYVNPRYIDMLLEEIMILENED